MLIYEALKNDHQKLKSLLDELVLLNDNATHKRSELISKIRDEFIPHARAEEAIFYNSLHAIESAKDIVAHSYEEHINAETSLRFLQLQDKIDADWKSTASKLRDSILHHIQEEERLIFPIAQQLFTREEAQTMTVAFESLKPKVRDEGLVKTTLDMVVNMMPARFAASLRTFNMNPRI